MAGVGPAPKNPEKRARTNSDPIPLRIVHAVAAPQPDLPTFTIQVTIADEMVTQEFQWSPMTLEWWTMLGQHPLAPEFIETDWSFLMETARIHEEFWRGKMSLAGELRLREAKYGFTPEDRARLRMQFAQAVSAETETKKQVMSARDRMRGVKRLEA